MADTDAQTLHPETDAWLRVIPGLTYPQALTARYPRIANALAGVRSDPEALHQQFHELLHDERGGRHGFPFDVMMDLLALREALIEDDILSGDDDATKWVS